MRKRMTQQEWEAKMDNARIDVSKPRPWQVRFQEAEERKSAIRRNLYEQAMREGGRVRSRVVDRVTGDEVASLLRSHVASTASLNTDESPIYRAIGQEFASHETVNHSADEYSRHDPDTDEVVTTNSVEGYFGNSKRSIDGTHHSISRKHASLYFAELDHKYNTRRLSDGERTVEGIRMIEGKRLMLHRPKGGK